METLDEIIAGELESMDSGSWNLLAKKRKYVPIDEARINTRDRLQQELPEIIHIIGDGLSGLVAAIELCANLHPDKATNCQGLVTERFINVKPPVANPPRVVIHQNKFNAQYNKLLHGSHHVTPMRRGALTRQTDIDFTNIPGIKNLNEVGVTAITRKHGWETGYVPTDVLDYDLVLMRRGSDSQSIDTHLKGIAEQLGADFTFDEINLDNPPSNSQIILATGLSYEMFQRLGMQTMSVTGYAYKGKSESQATEAHIYFPFAGTDFYGYTADMLGSKYGLIGKINQGDGLKDFIRQHAEHTGSNPSLWKEFPAAIIPHTKQMPRLLLPAQNGRPHILTGTLSGMIDPALYFGIVGAIESGHITAKAVLEGYDSAQRLFDYRTQNYRGASIIRRIFNAIPASARETIYRIIKHGAIGSRKIWEIIAQNEWFYEPLISYPDRSIPGFENTSVLSHGLRMLKKGYDNESDQK